MHLKFEDMIENLSYREVQESDFEKICLLPRNEEELFFMSPRSEYPLNLSQLESTIENRFDSTVVLWDNEIVGFANFYEVKEQEYCSIGNVIVDSDYRNKGIGKYLIKTMENIAVEKYKVSEFHLSCFNANTNGFYCTLNWDISHMK